MWLRAPLCDFFRVVLRRGRGFEIHWQVLSLAWPAASTSCDRRVEGIKSVPSKGQGRAVCAEQNVRVTSLPRLHLRGRQS